MQSPQISSPYAALVARIAALPHPRVLLLSGGGANGAAEAAAVLELYRAGYVPDLIIGTSIGAWNGAFLSAHPGIAGAEALVQAWAEGVFWDMSRLDPTLPIRLATGAAGSLVPQRSLERLGERTGLARLTTDDLQIPFICGAVQADNWERQLQYWDLQQMPGRPLLPYVEASAGIVPVLPPGKLDGHYWLDGGVRDNYGIVHAVRLLSQAQNQSASLMLLDCGPSEGMNETTSAFHGTNVSLSTMFRERLIAGMRAAGRRKYVLDRIDIGGDHLIGDFLNPGDGIALGAAAVHAWGEGRAIDPHWPNPSSFRRVVNAACFMVRSARHQIPDLVADLPGVRAVA